MTKPRFVYSLKKRQEMFSVAYISAVVAAAGYSVDDVKLDEDSIDVTIKQRGNSKDPNDYPVCSTLSIQLKCTYAHKPNNDNCIHFPLSKKNHNDLCRAHVAIPAILVVLYIPSNDESDWLVEQDEAMLLKNTAHWISLRGRTPITDTQTTVLIPIEQRFSVDSLRQIMNRLAQGSNL